MKKNRANAERQQEAIAVLRGQEREEAEWLLKHLELYERIKELKEKIQTEAKTDEDMKRLQTVAGVDPIVAYAYVAHVGNRCPAEPFPVAHMRHI